MGEAKCSSREALGTIFAQLFIPESQRYGTVAGVLAWVSADSLSADPSRATPSEGCQKDVAPFTLRTEQALLLQRNLHQTKELE